MTQVTLNAKQVEVLAELGIDPRDLGFVSGSKIHKYMVGADALTDGYYLIFVDEQLPATNNFIYYLGWESKMELEVKYAGLTIYSGADADGISDYISDDVEIEFPEEIEVEIEIEDVAAKQLVFPEAGSKTSKKELKELVLKLLAMDSASQVAKWAKQQGMEGIDLCYKAHWEKVLEKVLVAQ